MKILLISLSILMLTGCSALEKRIASVTQSVCDMSSAEQQVVAQKADAITYPNKIRVECAE